MLRDRVQVRVLLLYFILFWNHRGLVGLYVAQPLQTIASSIMSICLRGPPSSAYIEPKRPAESPALVQGLTSTDLFVLPPFGPDCSQLYFLGKRQLGLWIRRHERRRNRTE